MEVQLNLIQIKEFSVLMTVFQEGRLYDGYPKDDNSNLIENSEDLETKLIECLKFYKNDFYQSSVDYFINSKQK